MTDTTLIQKHLSQDLWDYAEKFDIPEDYLVDMSDLVEMVLRSKSIDTEEEKQNWFNLMPIMNNDQMVKLRDILVREKQKLEEIENSYEQKKMEIKKKYLMKWQKMGYFKKVEEIHKDEELSKNQEDEEAERLLQMI
ncbi:MAG: hypothetical protein V3575_07095 [Candidatus Absconditabacteria bacterium]